MRLQSIAVEQTPRPGHPSSAVSKQRAVTPRQVRRVMPSILYQLGTPALPPKLRGKSPRWRKGRVRTLAPRFPVVRKPKPVPKTRRKQA